MVVMALETRGVANAQRCGMRSLRRGAARESVEKGGDLTTLLARGGLEERGFPFVFRFGRFRKFSVPGRPLEALFEGDECN